MQFDVISGKFFLFVKTEDVCMVETFHLIISAPQPQTCVVTNPLYVLDKLLCHVSFKFRIGKPVYTAGKHKIHPYNQSEFITDIPEKIIRIVAASPNPYTVVICGNSLPQ